MKKIIMGVLLGVTILSHPIIVRAQDRQCPNPIEVTYEEAQELMQIAWCEAGNQGIDGQRYVMSVVINRVKSPDFPNTIHDVIYQPHQFATKGMKSADITAETHMALAELEMGNLVPEIVAFERAENSSLDVYFSEAFTFKDHVFYTCKH